MHTSENVTKLSDFFGKSRNCAFFGKSHETSGQFWKKSRNFVTISEREVTVGLRPKESTRKIKVTFDLRPKESIRKREVITGLRLKEFSTRERLNSHDMSY